MQSAEQHTMKLSKLTCQSIKHYSFMKVQVIPQPHGSKQLPKMPKLKAENQDFSCINSLSDIIT